MAIIARMKVLVTAATALSLILLVNPKIQAFEVTFPAGSGDYWTSCKANTLKWTTNSTESDIFSVAILNANLSFVNGNYQIANSLPSANGTAKVHINCLPPGDGYYLAFVNASKYSLNNPQVYYNSATFSIKDNSSTVLDGASAKSGPAASTTTGTTNGNTTLPTDNNQAANPVSGTTLDQSKTNGKNGAAAGITPPTTTAAAFVVLLSLIAMGTILLPVV